jgi:hypothetical protein
MHGRTTIKNVLLYYRGVPVMKKIGKNVLVPLIYDNTDLHLCKKLEYSWMNTASRVMHSGDGLPSLSRMLIACLNIKNVFSLAEMSIYG